MLQIDNINTIDKLENILSELQHYSIDISDTKTKLQEVIAKYEQAKRKDNSNRPTVTIDGNYELLLCYDLGKIEYDIKDYTLFLDLIHLTENWNLDIDIDNTFNYLESSINQGFLEKFYQINIQRLIIERYHDLLLKKILKDYQEGEKEYLEKYKTIKDFPYLKKSITKFLKDNNIGDIKIDEYDYNLELLFKKIGVSSSISENDYDKEKYQVSNPNSDLFISMSAIMNKLIENLRLIFKNDTKKIKEQLRIASFERGDFTGYDLRYVSFKHEFIEHSKFKGTRARINPQTIIGKNLLDCDLEGLDLSKANFDNVYIKYANLKGTRAKINPQTVKNKDLERCNLEGLDLSNANFNDVYIRFANLKGTNAKINPQTVRNKDLTNCNLEDLDLSEANFDDVSIRSTNLKGTNAKINPQTVRNKSLEYSNLEGLDLSEIDFDSVRIRKANLKGTGARINPQTIKFMDLEGSNLEGLDLSEANFDGVDIKGANLKSTNAIINPQTVLLDCYTSLIGCYVINDFDEYSDIMRPNLENAILVNSIQEAIEKRNNSLQFTFNNSSEEEGSKRLIKKRQNS